MKNIELGKVYYFNNRPILILRKETEDMYLVQGDFNIDHEVTGSCFCEPCNIDSYSEHTCIEAQEIIDTVMDDVSDKNVFWVARQYIKAVPFEYKACEELVKRKASLETEIARYQQDIKSCKKTIAKQEEGIGALVSKTSELQCDLDKIRGDIASYTEKRNKLETEIQGADKRTIEIGNKKLSPSELLELLQCRIELRLLEQGGVDNWEWYDESFGDVDVEAEALTELINM